MKKFYIAPFNYSIRVYTHDEKEDFEADYRVQVDNELACVDGNGVYFKECDIGIIYHEASHLVDVLLQDRLQIPNLHLHDTGELRAYLIEYVGNKIRKILGA